MNEYVKAIYELSLLVAYSVASDRVFRRNRSRPKKIFNGFGEREKKSIKAINLAAALQNEPHTVNAVVVVVVVVVIVVVVVVVVKEISSLKGESLQGQPFHESNKSAEAINYRDLWFEKDVKKLDRLPGFDFHQLGVCRVCHKMSFAKNCQNVSANV